MKKLALLLSLAVLLVSCSAGKVQRNESSTAKEGVYPDLIMENTTCSVGQSGSSPIVLKAEKMTLYSSDNYALLENFSFASEAEDGIVETEGQAEKGTIELDGSTITLSGNVSFSRPRDNMTIKAESLTYNKKRDEITTEGKVVVNSKEGIIEGYDFKGDLREGIYSFSRIAEGDFSLE